MLMLSSSSRASSVLCTVINRTLKWRRGSLPSYPLLAIVGNSNWKIEPPVVPGNNQIRPSWFSMIDWQIERPIPIPRALVVNIGLKSWATSDDLMPVPVSSIDTCTVLDRLSSVFMRSARVCDEPIELDGIHDQVRNHLL